MNKPVIRRIASAGAVIIALASSGVSPAQQPSSSGGSPYPYQASLDYHETGRITEGDLARASQNPVADLISVPFQQNFLFTEGDNDLIWNLNIQPVVPFGVHEEWNLITRTIVPVLAFENAPSPFDSFGLGDVTMSLFLSPVRGKRFTWGMGPIFSFPTATEDIFGSEKWGVGPSAVGLVMTGPWVLGVTANNLWSFAGEEDRQDVNALLIQPFVNYNYDAGWFATFSPIITADWEAPNGEAWTVPLGGGVGRVFPLGARPINASLQGYYNIEHPTGGPEWSIRFSVSLLFPR